MENSIEILEEFLFDGWFVHERWCGVENFEDLFCFDGLHWTGSPKKVDGLWKMDRDYREESIWERAYIKPVFLTKDHNTQGDGSGTDLREETGYNNETDNLYHQFYGKYFMLLYGLTNYNRETKKFPSFEEASNRDNYWTGDKGFFHAPVVRINLKKVAGFASCDNGLLDEYIKKDEELINCQLDLYKGANVFVCCNGSDWDNYNPSMDFLWRRYKETLKKDDGYNFLYYSPEFHVIVLHEYHMSSRTSYEEFYGAIPELERFLKEHPDFLDYLLVKV